MSKIGKIELISGLGALAIAIGLGIDIASEPTPIILAQSDATYASGQQYSVGDQVQYDGRLYTCRWSANNCSSRRPGQTGDWQLNQSVAYPWDNQEYGYDVNSLVTFQGLEYSCAWGSYQCREKQPGTSEAWVLIPNQPNQNQNQNQNSDQNSFPIPIPQNDPETESGNKQDSSSNKPSEDSQSEQSNQLCTNGTVFLKHIRGDDNVTLYSMGEHLDGIQYGKRWKIVNETNTSLEIDWDVLRTDHQGSISLPANTEVHFTSHYSREMGAKSTLRISYQIHGITATSAKAGSARVTDLTKCGGDTPDVNVINALNNLGPINVDSDLSAENNLWGGENYLVDSTDNYTCREGDYVIGANINSDGTIQSFKCRSL